VDEVPEVRTQQTSHTAPDAGGGQTEQTAQSSDIITPRLIELTNQEEYVLWKNWVDEIAPWVRYHYLRLFSPLHQIKLEI
jgi:hypothetical protein